MYHTKLRSKKMLVHKNWIRCALYLLIISVTGISFGQTSDSEGIYTYKKGSYDGTGKWFMGREIAYVMGFQGIRWLERKEREKEENTSTLIANMNIQKDDVIADIGAGSGYHVFRMAPIANEGMVYAVDIQKEMLSEIQRKRLSNDIIKVKTVLGGEKSINLPENSVDKILMVDVYHEFSFPLEMLQSIKKTLKPNGTLFLIEYRGEDDNVPIKKLHKMSEKQAVKELVYAGFKLERNINNLPWQHCMIFTKAEQ